MNNKILNNFPALGTKWWIEVFEEVDNIDLLRNSIEKDIKLFEEKYTRFKESSLLSKLNREREINTDEEFVDLLNLATKFSKESNNIFNIFIKEKLEEKGYGNTVASPEKIIEGDSNIKLENNKIILEGNKSIDLGGIGKGYLIDKLSNILQKKFGLKYFLINGGGDIYVTSDNEKEIELFLEHPTNKDQYINKIKIKNKSLCVSSSFKRVWNKEGEEVNHFIGEENVWAISYIVGGKATNADVFGTIACILSSNENKIKSIYKDFDVEYMVINQKGEVFKSNSFPKLY